MIIRLTKDVELNSRIRVAGTELDVTNKLGNELILSGKAVQFRKIPANISGAEYKKKSKKIG